jgi:hypothetical protein
MSPVDPPVPTHRTLRANAGYLGLTLSGALGVCS